MYTSDETAQRAVFWSRGDYEAVTALLADFRTSGSVIPKQNSALLIYQTSQASIICDYDVGWVAGLAEEG